MDTGAIIFIRMTTGNLLYNAQNFHLVPVCSALSDLDSSSASVCNAAGFALSDDDEGGKLNGFSRVASVEVVAGGLLRISLSPAPSFGN